MEVAKVASKRRIPFAKPAGTALARIDPNVRRYNEINAAICHLLPATARAYVTIRELLPLFRLMQPILSQRLKWPTHETVGFEVVRLAGVSVAAVPAANTSELPSWSFWLATWARELDYSVRHLRRLIFDERPKEKYISECGWSGNDHTHAASVAILGLALAKAVRAGVETAALVEEILRLAERRLPDPEWQIQSPGRRRRPARRTLDEGMDIGRIA
jgi:hypothetical protein